ncbi:DUF4350 domain-containing protein [Stenotrophomonas sp. Iso1]|uniref:DUF4350 domain-containing protein n=1 Tax=Stenotrophomonas sp. Iso1 TaxID=2977283 RepID=UPI0022B77E9A|nr:DUF4350 domain-containing protein [Stenotrophomonas sp. Iso1]
MSLRWRYALIALVALLLCGVLTVLFLSNYERGSEEITLPAYGEPTYNPLFALRETIRRDGGKAESRRQLDLPTMRLQPGDTVLMLDDPRLLTPSQVDDLLDWVQFGGHLVLRAQEPDEALDADGNNLLHRLGVAGQEGFARCQTWQVPGQESHQEFCGGTRFTLDGTTRVEYRWSDGNADKSVAWARLRYGTGRVDILGDMDFLLNGTGPGDPGLRDLPHRDLSRLVLAPNYGQGTVHLVYAMEMPSLWKTVIQRGWPIWLPLLLALLAWLWARSQRFGALLPSPREERRSLLEHVRASGELLHRYGKSPLLYDAVRQSFLARLRRRSPMAAALTGEAQVQAIADHLQWPISRVQTAMQVPPSRDDTALRERIRLLIQMRNQL